MLHLSYEAQLAWKSRMVRDELAPLFVAVKPCVAAPSPWDYRTRVKLVATSHPQRKLMLGAFAPRSHNVLDIAGCQTNRRTLMAVAKTVAEQAAALGITPYDEATAEGSLRYLLLREVDSGAVQVSWVMADRPVQLSALWMRWCGSIRAYSPSSCITTPAGAMRCFRQAQRAVGQPARRPG